MEFASGDRRTGLHPTIIFLIALRMIPVARSYHCRLSKVEFTSGERRTGLYPTVICLIALKMIPAVGSYQYRLSKVEFTSGDRRAGVETSTSDRIFESIRCELATRNAIVSGVGLTFAQKTLGPDSSSEV